jgi:hypothetical protein
MYFKICEQKNYVYGGPLSYACLTVLTLTENLSTDIMNYFAGSESIIKQKIPSSEYTSFQPHVLKKW